MMNPQQAIAIRDGARRVLGAFHGCIDVLLPRLFSHIKKERAERSALQLIDDEQQQDMLDGEKCLELSGLQLSSLVARCTELVSELQELAKFYGDLAQWFQATATSVPQSSASSPTAPAIPPPPAPATPTNSCPPTGAPYVVTGELACKVMKTVHLRHTVMYVDPSIMRSTLEDARRALEGLFQIAYPAASSQATLTAVTKFCTLCWAVAGALQAIYFQYKEPLEEFVKLLEAVVASCTTTTT
ncbi:hypothetical protein Pelo_17673 [Pelomyxa schiedti]|nr:hypothetical protein Pelo_17673 [Pelomyxa schiedti]